MFKLGFCIYGPQCRYRHTRLPGPPPDPKEVDAAKPKEYRAGGKDADRHEGLGGRGRGRYRILLTHVLTTVNFHLSLNQKTNKKEMEHLILNPKKTPTEEASFSMLPLSKHPH